MAGIASVLPRVLQDGRTVPTDEAHSLILELAQLKPGDKVLEVGTGSGTTARALSHAACDCSCDSCILRARNIKLEAVHCGSPDCCNGIELHTVELEPIYLEVLSLDPEQVYFHRGDGKLGLEHEAPFDAIVATCGVERVPEAWERQLKEGGRLVCPLGQPAAQRLVLAVKEKNTLQLKRVRAYVRFSMMR